jgi:hypothetical protein
MNGSGKETPTFATYQLSDIQPGPRGSVNGCPPPTEIVCIVTEKVYDECKSTQVNEEEFIVMAKAGNPVVRTECKKIKLLNGPVCDNSIPGSVCVTFTYQVKIKVFFRNDTSATFSRDVTVVKNFNVFRAGGKGLEVQCFIPFIECLRCDVKREKETEHGTIETTIVCSVANLLVIKLTATVQLLIPAYGFSPEPPNCDEISGEDSDFDPPWPPLPPQDW